MDSPTWADFVGGWVIFRDPVLAGILAGGTLGALGVFVVLRRMVFVAAVLSQGAGLGVALAFCLHVWFDLHAEPMLGAVTLSLVATALFTLSPERFHVSRESVLGMAWVGAGAAAIVLGDHIAAEAHDINAILFGSAVLVRPIDVALVSVVTLLVVGMLAWWGRGLLYASFDPDGARVHGLPVRLLDGVLWLLVALAVSISTRALGAMPVFAFSVLPAMAAMLLAPRLNLLFPVAGLLGALAGGLGYLLAFFQSWPVGASQALVAGSFVLLAWPFAGRR